MLHLSVHFAPYLHNVGIARGGHQNANRTLVVAVEGIASGLLVALLNMGNVAQAQLVIIVSLDKHLSDLFHAFEFVRYVQTDALVPIVEVAAVGGLVLSVEGSQHFSRLHS